MQVAWVPGSFELPVVAKAMAKSGKYGAVVAIGVIVSFLLLSDALHDQTYCHCLLHQLLLLEKAYSWFLMSLTYLGSEVPPCQKHESESMSSKS